MTRRIHLGPALAVVLVAAAPAPAAELGVAAQVTPAQVHIGEIAHYTGYVIVPRGLLSRPKWLPPDTSSVLTWGPLEASKHPGTQGDTVVVETTLQAFVPGPLTIPGLAFVDEARAPGVVRRIPALNLTVVPVIPAADSSADLKPVRGPLRAPWWEVVPWLWVLAIALAAAAITWLLLRLRRRETMLVPVAAAASTPADSALARLEALRARRLPEAGKFGEHALELTSILRRYLEATMRGLRPGFTTTDLARRMAEEQMPEDEVRLLASLMRIWDRVKFARAPSTVDEARQAEAAVEAFLRRRRTATQKEAA